ncbi:MAG: hypothetical protein R3F02_13755 [Thiolinea sp.]
MAAGATAGAAAAATAGGAGASNLSSAFGDALAKVEASQTQQLDFQQKLANLQTAFQAKSSEIENDTAMASALRSLTRAINQSLRQG